MSLGHLKGIREWLRADFLSPKDLLLRAGTISLCFGIAHLAGLRQHTTFLSGTLADPAMSWPLASFLGGLYVLLYFAFALLVPILVIAAGLAQGHHRVWRPKGSRDGGPGSGPRPMPGPSRGTTVSRAAPPRAAG
jgi:hypothetical protein